MYAKNGRTKSLKKICCLAKMVYYFIIYYIVFSVQSYFINYVSPSPRMTCVLLNCILKTPSIGCVLIPYEYTYIIQTYTYIHQHSYIYTYILYTQYLAEQTPCKRLPDINCRHKHIPLYPFPHLVLLYFHYHLRY